MTAVPIGEVCVLVTDGTHYTPPVAVSGVPFLTVKDMRNGHLDFDSAARISQEEFTRARAGNSAPVLGDILFSKDGTVGKVHVVGEQREFAVLSSIAILRPDPERLDPRYLGHALRAPAIQRRAMRSQTGTAVRRVILSDLQRIVIPLPPLDAQHRIAELLDTARETIALRRTSLRLLAELRTATFNHRFGPTVAHKARWPIEPVTEVCSLVVDCVNRTAPTTEEPTEFKMIRTTNVRDGAIDLTSVRYVDEPTFMRWNRRAIPERGDVILTREAPVGEVGVLDTDDRVFLGQRLMLYRVDPQRMTSAYLVEAFRSPFLWSQFVRNSSGTTVKHLPLPACRGFEVVVPPIAAQQEFAGEIEAIGAARRHAERHLECAEALLASLEHGVFGGAG